MGNILITGCSGFLAGHLSRVLAEEKGNRIFGFTEIGGFTSSAMQAFHCDIRRSGEVEAIVADVKPDLVFHLAAVTHVGFAWKNPVLTYEVNFLGSENLFLALQRHAPRARVVAMSSAEIYDRSDRPINERAAIACHNPYSLSKRALEMLAALHWESSGQEIVLIRSFNFTGPGQEKRFVASDFAAQIAAIEKGLQAPVLRVGNLSAVRDFSDVRDVARYLLELSRRGRPNEPYNICAGKGYSIRQILDLLLSFSQKTIRVEIDPEKFRPLDMPVLIGDCTRLSEELGLSPRIPIERTLGDLLDFWRAVDEKGP